MFSKKKTLKHFMIFLNNTKKGLSHFFLSFMRIFHLNQILDTRKLCISLNSEP